MDLPKRATYVSVNLATTSISPVHVVRRKSGGRVELGTFLVDFYCLGVKNAFFKILDEAEFNDLLEGCFPEGYETQEAAYGRKLVESAVAYARNLGIAPHSDYKKGARVFGGVDAADCDEEFTFGMDGKPHYIQGPHDTPAFRNKILALLTAKLGKDGFNFIVLADDFDDDDYDDEDSDSAPPALIGLESGSTSTTPSPELKALGDEFARTELFDGKLYCECDVNPLADMLKTLILQLHASILADEKLHKMFMKKMEDSLLTSLASQIIALWNYAYLPESMQRFFFDDSDESRNKLFDDFSTPIKKFVTDSQIEDIVSRFFIFQHKFIEQEEPGEFRLLVIVGEIEEWQEIIEAITSKPTIYN